MVVNAAIFSKAYTDESVLLSALIYPDVSMLNENTKFKASCKKLNISLQAFSENFWQQANKTGDENLLLFLNKLKPRDLRYEYSATRIKVNTFWEEQQEDPSIYYPYSQNYDNDEPITTLVTATEDADEGWGSQPYYLNGIFQGYNQVLVNDDYAEETPTHIIGVNGIAPETSSPTAGIAFAPEPPVQLPGLPREVKQVYVGDVQCKKQYDSLISFTGNGGGSEIRFTRADGFLKILDGQVQADVYIIGDGSISRKNIRKENFVEFLNEWDGDWEANNLQQNLAIYEEDNRNSSTFTGNLSTTVKVPATAGTPEISATRGIGFTINYKSDDALIKQTNYNRDVFFILNRTDLEGKMYKGWPVRDKNANVSFTLQDRTYY